MSVGKKFTQALPGLGKGVHVSFWHIALEPHDTSSLHLCSGWEGSTQMANEEQANPSSQSSSCEQGINVLLLSLIQIPS